MSIKVCHITSVHQRYDTRIFLKECTSLAEAGYDVTLLVADEKPRERLNNVDIIPVPGIPKSRLPRILKSGNMMLLAALEINAEIYHLHDPELLPLAMKLKKLNKRVIFDSHENYPLQIKEKTYIPYLLRNIISVFYKRYETKITKMIDAVVIPATLNGGQTCFENRSLRTEIISNATLKSEFYDNYEKRVEEEGAPTICYVGALTHNRGVTHLIKAAYKANVKLVLAGTFSPLGYHEELRKMPEYGCVEYRGQIDRAQVLALYREVSVGASTLLNIGQYKIVDNLATKTYEYMSMGIPVIISRYAYAEKVLKKYEFGISVDPENIDEMVCAIRYLVDNPEKAKHMGICGRTAIKEMFNWEIEEKKLIALYKELLSTAKYTKI